VNLNFTQCGTNIGKLDYMLLLKELWKWNC